MRSRNVMMQRRVYGCDHAELAVKATALQLAEQLLMIIRRETAEEEKHNEGGEASCHGDCASFVDMDIADFIHTEISYGSFVERLSRASFVFAGVEAALEWLTEKFRDTYAIEIEMRKDGGKIDLDKRVGYFIFLAVCELLENVARHAQADRVLVSVMKNGEVLQVNVRDNGVGFDPVITLEFADEASGCGLSGIREKVAFLGGSLTIESKRGQCTHASLVVPLGIRRH